MFKLQWPWTRRDEQVLFALASLERTILSKLEELMSDANASFENLSTKIDGLTGVINTAVTDFDGLKTEVDQLKQQVASGSGVTAAQLDALSAKIDTAQQNLSAADTRDQPDRLDPAPGPASS